MDWVIGIDIGAISVKAALIGSEAMVWTGRTYVRRSVSDLLDPADLRAKRSLPSCSPHTPGSKAAHPRRPGPAGVPVPQDPAVGVARHPRDGIRRPAPGPGAEPERGKRVQGHHPRRQHALPGRPHRFRDGRRKVESISCWSRNPQSASWALPTTRPAAIAPPGPAPSWTSRPGGCSSPSRTWAASWIAEKAAKIAGRCSVFAKSDMIHAQQKGYTPPEIPRGSVRRGGPQLQELHHQGEGGGAPGRVSSAGFPGTPACVRAIEDAFELKRGDLQVPPIRLLAGRPGRGPAGVGSRPSGTPIAGLEILDRHMAHAALGFPTTPPLIWRRWCSCATASRRTPSREKPHPSARTSASTSVR